MVESVIRPARIELRKSLEVMTQKKQAASIERQISANLRRVYCDDGCDSMPDQFSALLDQLRSVDLSSPENPDADTSDAPDDGT